MALYKIQYIHKIAPKPGVDNVPDVEIRDGAFSDKKILGKELRKLGILCKNARINYFRVDENKVAIFPSVPGLTTYWHAIILES